MTNHPFIYAYLNEQWCVYTQHTQTICTQRRRTPDTFLWCWQLRHRGMYIYSCMSSVDVCLAGYHAPTNLLLFLLSACSYICLWSVYAWCMSHNHTNAGVSAIAPMPDFRARTKELVVVSWYQLFLRSRAHAVFFHDRLVFCKQWTNFLYCVCIYLILVITLYDTYTQKDN